MGYKLTGMYIGQDKIRPSGGGGWQPGADTLIYLKLDGDTNNYGSSYSMSSTGTQVSFSSIGGIQVGYFNNGGLYTNVADTSELNGSLTYNIWIKTGSNATMGRYIVTVGLEQYYQSRVLATNGNNSYRASFWFSDLDTPANSLVFDTWQNVVFTLNGTSKYRAIYINGNKVADDTASMQNFSSTQIGVGTNASLTAYVEYAYLSKVIVENKERTAQEVADYFNLTKGDYGIS